MQFEWDDAKSDACFIYRGFDFTYALRAFFDDGRVVTRDRRWDYGEDRVFVLIYTVRGAAIRIISARKANRKEIREYEHHASQG